MAKKKNNGSAGKVWGLTRISLGFIFLWAFFDKLIGLGFATCRDAATDSVEIMCSKAWLEGGSPTGGFLKFGTEGSPFESIFQGMAGNAIWDWLFMLGLLGIGTALVLGIGMRVAAYSGVLLMTFMYLAAFQPENNPLIDDHVIYALVLIGLYKVNDDQRFGLAKWWASQSIVKKYPILK